MLKIREKDQMNLGFDIGLSEGYKSKSQIARVLTEHWVLHNSYCPCCGNHHLHKYQNNTPAADFFCPHCAEEYELKSSNGPMLTKVVDGAYDTMMHKIMSATNPTLFFLSYTSRYKVRDFFAVPRHYFVPEIIERRTPLGQSARRAGWVGCTILLGNLPSAGRIYMVRDESVVDPGEVVEAWQKTSFLGRQRIQGRGWLIELISLIEKLPSKTFSLSDVYAFEPYLRRKFPNNRFVKAKIRQQLQVLRDKHIIKFVGKGAYEKI